MGKMSNLSPCIPHGPNIDAAAKSQMNCDTTQAQHTSTEQLHAVTVYNCGHKIYEQ